MVSGFSPMSVQQAPFYQPAQESLCYFLIQWLSGTISVNQPASVSPVCPIDLYWELLALFAVQKQTISLFNLQMKVSSSVSPVPSLMPVLDSIPEDLL